MTTLGLSDVRKRLKAAIAEAGTATALAERHGLNKSQISRAVNGEKPSATVLQALGLKEVERAPRYQEAAG